MKSNSDYLANPKSPLLWIMVLFSLFFLANHNFELQRASREQSSGNEIFERVESGNQIRRSAFVFIGTFGLLNIMFKKRLNALNYKNLFGILTIIFLAWATLSVLWSSVPNLTLRRLIVQFLILIIVYAILRNHYLEDFIALVFFCSALFVFSGIVFEILHGGAFRIFDLSYRYAGTVHPNAQAKFCALVLVSGYFLLKVGYRKNIFITSVMTVTFFLLLMTKSRTTIGSLIVSAGVYWFFEAPSKKRFLTTITAGIALGLGMLFAAKVVPLAFNVVEFGREEESLNTLTVARVPLWETCILYARERPLAGYGFNSFWDSERRADEISVIHPWMPANAHSSYLDLLLSLGVVGFFLAIVIVLGCARRAMRISQFECNAAYGFAFFVIIFLAFGDMFESTLMYPSFISFVFATVLAFTCFLPVPGTRKSV